MHFLRTKWSSPHSSVTRLANRLRCHCFDPALDRSPGRQIAGKDKPSAAARKTGWVARHPWMFRIDQKELAVTQDIVVRVGEAKDAAVLTNFNMAMAIETEGKRLLPGTVAAGVRGLLENPAAGFYVVAEWDGQVVGALMVTFEWSDWRNKCFWWIQSVYVRPANRRSGIFTRLFAAVRSIAAARSDICGLRLYVEQHNQVAQATYKSLGMDETHYDMYEVEFE